MKKIIGFITGFLLFVECLPLLSAAADTNIPNGFQEAAKNDSIALYYNESKANIAVQNLNDGKWWYSNYPDSSVYESAADTVKIRMESLLSLDYVDMGGNSSKVESASLQELPYDLSVQIIDNGFIYTITITKLNISLDIEFIIEGSSLKVRIPDKSFLENSDGLEKSRVALDDIKKNVNLLEKVLNNIRGSMNSASVGQAEYELFMLMFDACQQEIIKIRDNIKGEGVVFTAISNIRSNLEIVFTNLQDTNAYSNEREDIERYLNIISEKFTIVSNSATCLVSSIEILPYFGSTVEEEDGYAFYPDGPGAISYFSETYPDYIGYYDSSVYSEQEQNIDLVNQNKISGKKIAGMPVFGIRSMGSAFMAYIDKGDADAKISYYPKTQLQPLYSVYSTLIYRNFYITTTSNAQKLKALEKERISGDRVLVYSFLSGDNANYSGMAKTYRQHLLDTGMLKRNAEVKDPKMQLDLLMGIRKKSFLFNKFISMTSFAQAEDILAELKKRGVANPDVALLGWNETGIMRNPYSTKPSKKLGGINGIEKLTSAAQQKGFPLFLYINPVEAQKGVSGFSLANDVVRQKSSLVVSDSAQKTYWLDSQHIYDRLIAFLLPKNKWLHRTDGLYLDNIGSLIYTNYKKNRVVSRGDTIDIYNNMCKEINQDLGQVMIGGSNLYAAKYSTVLREVPTYDTGYFFTNETVPFIQMVYHGYVLYCDKPFNLFANPKVDKLRAIEYGSMPYYKLTYKSSSRLKGTLYNALFSSEVNQWYDDIQVTNNMYKEIFHGICNCTIEKHEKVADKVYQTKYSDGTAVYVNYRSTDFADGSINISPYSYFVSRKG